ncbi:MAG: ribosome biogenesis GTPase Der [Pseudomonadota bacterium]
MHPILAIVGRPNVGKSRLFNRIVGQRRAIVADVPGVTRDRHYAEAEWAGREFVAVDTGGLDLDPAADLEREISKQSLKAIEEADVVVCLFDGQNDPTADDREVVAALRRISKPVIYAINKIDEASHEGLVHSYHELGATPVVAVSAEHGRGVDDLLDEVIRRFPPESAGVEDEQGIFVAVVGRPNVGKSTLINRLVGEERVVANEMPGATRDAINVEIDFEGKKYIFIDTAGIKRRWGVAERLEKFTAMRSLRTIDRAKIVLQLIDGSEGLTKQDLHLTGFVREAGRGLILLVNKWDLMSGRGRTSDEQPEWEEYEKRLRKGMGELHDIPAFPISASTGQNCLRIFKGIDQLEKCMGTKIATSVLNRVLEKALAEHHMPVHRGKQVRIYYATQVATHPPTFALFSNLPAAVPYTYRRYLIRRLQDELGMEGVPVRVVCRKK